MSSRTKTQRFRRLISHGFFAPELPPCFISHDLARYRETVWSSIEAVPPARRRAQGGAKQFISEPSWFYFPRFNRNDRKHGIINPISYLAIARTVSDNFVKLRQSARRSKISVSPLIFDWSGTRALFRPGIDLRDDFRVDLSNRCKELVAADIRAFFHSIYTHAIPWAIYGKSNAKRNRNISEYGNLLDLYCRNSQDGQTIGLPVGPDTSRLIAEVIASAVDVKLCESLPIRRGDASRYVDDYSAAVLGDLHADEILAEIRRAVSGFELELNSDKSLTLSTAARFPTGWKQAVLSYIPRQNRAPDDFSRFFYEVGRVCKEQPEINVEKFAFQNARRALVHADNWAPIQSHLINSYRRNSTLVSFLAEILILRQQHSADADLVGLKGFLEIWLDELAKQDRTGEIIWLLFMAFRLEIEIRASRIKGLFRLENSMVALLVTIGKEYGFISGQIDKNFWNAHVSSEGLRSPMWLYVYETLRRGLGQRNTDQILTNDPYFSVLKARNISFFDLSSGFASMDTTMLQLRAENRRASILRSDFMEDFDFDLEEFDSEEDEDLDEFETFSDEY